MRSRVRRISAEWLPEKPLQINGPEATVARFFSRLDATPYFNAWPLPPTQQVAFSITHNPRKVVVRVRAHPRELDVSAAHLAFLLRYRLATDKDESEMLTFRRKAARLRSISRSRPGLFHGVCWSARFCASSRVRKSD